MLIDLSQLPDQKGKIISNSFSPSDPFSTGISVLQGALTGTKNMASTIERGGKSFGDWLASKITGKPRQYSVNEPTITERLIPEFPASTPQQRLGQTVGRIGSEIAASTALGAGVARVLPASATGIAGSALSTAVITGGNEGRLPSTNEFLAYGALDALLWGGGKLGSAIYRSAFKAVPPKLEKELIKTYKKHAADTAEELGYIGSDTAIKEKASASASAAWEELKTIAQNSRKVSREDFQLIANKAARNMAKGLPLTSQEAKGIMEEVKTKIMAYAPKTSASGTQLVGIVTRLNQGLYGKGAVSALSDKAIRSFETSFKNEIKDMLPEGIRPLYETMAKNKLIEEVMANQEVRKYLARGLVTGTGLGATAGVVTGVQGGNVWDVLKNAIVTGVITGATASATGKSTALKTGAGSALKFLSTHPIRVVVKSVVNQLTQPKTNSEIPLLTE